MIGRLPIDNFLQDAVNDISAGPWPSAGKICARTVKFPFFVMFKICVGPAKL